MSPIRVLVVDDHDLFRRGLIDLLKEEEDIEVVGEARDGREAVQRAEELDPDVVFMDLNMPHPNGIEVTAYLTRRRSRAKVLILTVSEEAEDLYRAITVGALGYVLKNAKASEIVNALRQVYQGWVVVSPALAPRFLSEMHGPTEQKPRGKKSSPGETGEALLTFRERQILEHVATGMSNAEIAAELIVSENTVKTHVKNILAKLQTKNRREAAVYAGALGLLQTGQDTDSDSRR